MRKFYSIVIALFITLGISAQSTTIDISAISSTYTKTVDGVLVIDVATASTYWDAQFNSLKPGIYIKKAIYSNVPVKSTKIGKLQ